jgi:hypothetical protein
MKGGVDSYVDLSGPGNLRIVSSPSLEILPRPTALLDVIDAESYSVSMPSRRRHEINKLSEHEGPLRIMQIRWRRPCAIVLIGSVSA